MIGLRRAVDVARLVRDLPELIRLQAEFEAATASRLDDIERRLSTIETDIVELSVDLADHDAVIREHYLGRDEPPADGPQLCDFCRDHPGQVGCTNQACLTNARPAGGGRDAA
ncbi:MAG TPA: hypothetical protein VFZ00_01550 [Solirubrobacter sp.]|nr:hypothetical protein [Solirubrobacter sp.]